MTHYSRRRVLKMVGLVTIASAAGQLLPLPRLNAAQVETHVAGLDDFMYVSQRLTMQASLNATVARALIVALSQTQKGFLPALAQLKALLQNQPDLLQQDHLTFATDADSEKLAKAILGGWYNGVVGKGNHALYVTYVNTLANLLVDDKLVPPGFSYGECGSWAKQP